MHLQTVQLGDTGTPLLMLHGWGQSLVSLQPLAELLAPAARVYLIDLPGHGRSDPPDGDWDTIRYAACIRQYMDNHGLDRADVLGHSFGGRVALRLADACPERVRSLVLLSAAGLRPYRSPRQRIRVRLIRWLRALFRHVPLFGPRLTAWHTQQFGSRDYKNAGALRGTFVKTVVEDQTPVAARIHAPTLLIWGDRDTEAPLEMGRRLQRLISGSTLIVLPGRDHFLFEGENAHLCAYYILQFLHGLSAVDADRRQPAYV